jgi:glutathione S-transferase
MTAALVLYQFAFSHYNEKVRWTLDWKGLSCERRSLLPGLHERTIRRFTGGSTQTPLLRDGERAIAGSAAIVAHLEAGHPEPPLFPEDPERRRRAEAWVEWLDEEVGPAVRLALFHELLADPAYAGRMFTTGQGALRGASYRLLFPRLVPMLRRRMGIDAESAAAARQVVEEALARVDAATRGSGYLVGDRFGVADLSAASLLFPLLFPPQLGFALPAGPSPVLDAWTARWRDRPGAAWVLEMWAKHRQSEMQT